MKEPQTLSSVSKFHQTFQHPILDTPQIPLEARCNLRVSLIAEELKELEEAIQRSNMSKACKTIAEAEATQKFYLEKDGTESYYQEKDGLYLVYRTSDNKTLKSVGYSPADLKSILGK